MACQLRSSTRRHRDGPACPRPRSPWVPELGPPTTPPPKPGGHGATSCGEDETGLLLPPKTRARYGCAKARMATDGSRTPEELTAAAAGCQAEARKLIKDFKTRNNLLGGDYTPIHLILNGL